MSIKQNDPKFRRAFERGVLRSAFKSLFWAIIAERKKRPEGFKLTDLAKAISTSKHEVSRWFSGDPNWTINTISNLADALDVQLEITARDKMTGVIYTPEGIQSITVSQPMAKTIPIMGFTKSSPLIRQVKFTRVPDDSPMNLIGFDSAA